MGQVDLVFFDGHHQAAPTLAYFEQCLPYAHSRTLFVFDDIYASEEMTAAWSHIRQHERLTLTVDCFDLAFAFFHPEMREKQHLRLVPTQWKPWAKFL
jgi:predicted O-methyltransferase YrrM